MRTACGGTCQLQVGTKVLLDLDQYYRKDWPLVAHVGGLRDCKGDIVMKVVWYDSLYEKPKATNARFTATTHKDGTPLSNTVYGFNHYYCGFDLDENGRLPVDARGAYTYHEREISMEDAKRQVLKKAEVKEVTKKKKKGKDKKKR